MSLLRGEHIGIFSGYGDSKYEIVSKILIPYHAQKMPLQGSFLVVVQEDFSGQPGGILGRVTKAIPSGDLFSEAGEDYLIDLVRMNYPVPEEVKQGRLRYRVSLRLLGQIADSDDGSIRYSPSIRQMPHVGAPVGFPSDAVLQFIARGCAGTGDDPGPSIGHLAIGDMALDGSDRVRGKSVPVHFRMDSLVGRRTAVFARAGMGKSNFVKVLLTRLYETAGRNAPGTLIVDPEGEYAFRNDSEPGLLDVPALRDRIVVYTNRKNNSTEYAANIAGDCTVNLGDLDPVEAVATIIAAAKQDMVFANLLRSVDRKKWRDLIVYLDSRRYSSRHSKMAEIIGTKIGKSNDSPDGFDVKMAAIVNNLVPALHRLHSTKSTLLTQPLTDLAAGKIVILDLSLSASHDAYMIASWIMGKIFANNQEAFSAPGHGGPTKLIPCLAVLEEAQFYLGDQNLKEASTFVRWFKEGRKFKLGSVVVTQQPGAIGPELISQCDNYFIFHLLSRIDLNALEVANLHFAGDIATSIGQEPIPGNCFLWSSKGLSFVTCAKIMHFRNLAVDVPMAAIQKGHGVIRLPVKETVIGAANVQWNLAEMIRRLVETESRVHVHTVAHLCDDLGRAAAEAGLIAASRDFLHQRLAEALGKEHAAGMISDDVYTTICGNPPDGLRLAAAVQEALAESDFVPSAFRVHHGGRLGASYLFRQDKLDLAGKKIRPAIDVEVEV